MSSQQDRIEEIIHVYHEEISKIFRLSNIASYFTGKEYPEKFHTEIC